MMGVKIMSGSTTSAWPPADRRDPADHPAAVPSASPTSIIDHSYGYGAGHPWGYSDPAVGGLLSAYVMYGFDTAGTLAEETNDPRRHAPPAIIRAIAAAALIGGLGSCSRSCRTRTSPTRTSACSGFLT